MEGHKLKVKPVDAFIYHYGWVKHPQLQQRKRDNVGIYWSNDEKILFNKEQTELFNYLNDADSLEKFPGTHPLVMQNRIKNKNWDLTFDLTKKRLSLKDQLLYLFAL